MILHSAHMDVSPVLEQPLLGDLAAQADAEDVEATTPASDPAEEAMVDEIHPKTNEPTKPLVAREAVEEAEEADGHPEEQLGLLKYADGKWYGKPCGKAKMQCMDGKWYGKPCGKAKMQ